jgi:hypothetical protein
MAASSWALPAALVAGIYLVREAATVAPKAVDYVVDLVDDSISRTIAATTAAGGAVASSGEYYGKLARDASREAAAQAAVAAAIPVVERQQVAQIGKAGYGSVAGSEGTRTGIWRNIAPTPGNPSGDRCAVDAPSVHGYGTRFYTGAYCRAARAQGLIA